MSNDYRSVDIYRFDEHNCPYNDCRFYVDVPEKLYKNSHLFFYFGKRAIVINLSEVLTKKSFKWLLGRMYSEEIMQKTVECVEKIRKEYDDKRKHIRKTN